MDRISLEVSEEEARLLSQAGYSVDRWKLLSRHDFSKGGELFDTSERTRNSTDVSLPLFLDLAIDFDPYRDAGDGQLLFKVVWPMLRETAHWARGHGPEQQLLEQDFMLWSQASTPREFKCNGYHPISVPYPGGKHAFDGVKIDGSNTIIHGNHNAWWYCMAATEEARGWVNSFGGMPGPMAEHEPGGQHGGWIVQNVELWIGRPTSPNIITLQTRKTADARILLTATSVAGDDVATIEVEDALTVASAEAQLANTIGVPVHRLALVTSSGKMINGRNGNYEPTALLKEMLDCDV